VDRSSPSHVILNSCLTFTSYSIKQDCLSLLLDRPKSRPTLGSTSKQIIMEQPPSMLFLPHNRCILLVRELILDQWPVYCPVGHSSSQAYREIRPRCCVNMIFNDDFCVILNEEVDFSVSTSTDRCQVCMLCGRTETGRERLHLVARRIVILVPGRGESCGTKTRVGCPLQLELFAVDTYFELTCMLSMTSPPSASRSYRHIDWPT
jgi:hypothetical protein